MITFTTAQAKLLRHFLRELGEHQANAGCNDFDLSLPEIGLSPEEQKEIVDAYRSGASAPSSHPMDFELVAVLNSLLEGEGV